VQKKEINVRKEVILQSIITCPNCGHQKEESMPMDACQYFYGCENCKINIKTQERALLRILFIWNSTMSINTKSEKMLLMFH